MIWLQSFKMIHIGKITNVCGLIDLFALAFSSLAFFQQSLVPGQRDRGCFLLNLNPLRTSTVCALHATPLILPLKPVLFVSLNHTLRTLIISNEYPVLLCLLSVMFIAGVRGSHLKSVGRKRSRAMNLASVMNRFLFYDRDQKVYAVFNHIIIGNKG